VREIAWGALVAVFLAGCASSTPPRAKSPPPPPAGVAPAASNASDGAGPATLLRDLDSPVLAGVDDRHVYWISRKPAADTADEPAAQVGAGRLMRVLKTGGTAETVLEPAILAPGCGFAADDRRIWFVEPSTDSADPSFTGAIVAVDREAPHKRVRLADRRPGACHLVAAEGRLFWTEHGDSGSDEGPAAGTARVMTARTDGSDLHVLWQSEHAQTPRGLLADGSRLVVALASSERPAGPGGLGSMGQRRRNEERQKPDGDRSAVSLVSLATPGGSPRAFPAIPVADPHDLGLAGLDGGDVLLCTPEGLFRLARDGSGAARLAGPACPATMRAWNGWGVFAESLTQPGALVARRLTDQATSVEVFAHVAPFSVADVHDRDAFYACVSAEGRGPDRCDLVRVTPAVFAARSHAPAGASGESPRK
jgi:hypothetical protein